MMRPFSEILNFAPDAQVIPPELVEEARRASRSINEPDHARQAYEMLEPVLLRYRPDPEFAVACGMLIEKQFQNEGMLDFWADLRRIFPDEISALRMLMRWYRRVRQINEGIAYLYRAFPQARQKLDQAGKVLMGLTELQAHDEIDRFMSDVLKRHPDARALRLKYVKTLDAQSRFKEAAEAAAGLPRDQALGRASLKLVEDVGRRAEKAEALKRHGDDNLFSEILRLRPKARARPETGLGPVTFFTGQLGTGGAERQLAMIAMAFQGAFDRGKPVGPARLSTGVSVCVRHANPAQGADFYRPQLQEAGVETTVLSEVPPVNSDDIDLSDDLLALFELLPKDIREQTCKLIPYFQTRRTDVAYLWQDGGVAVASLAAVLAGVPRIITSFRGLPPVLRPKLFRAEYEPLYRALLTLPQVTFTANSRTSARAYEDWLELPSGTVLAIPNAVAPVRASGAVEDYQFWQDMQDRSPACTKTVLGVFRFDTNKRPLMWIDVAARYVAENPDTRFLLLGTGFLFSEVKSRIRKLGLEDRIFLAGLRKNVGFYMHRSQIILHLAEMEGLPNVLIEAHLAGRPVVATPAGGTAEVVIDGETGHILQSAEDPSEDEIVRALGDLLNDPQRCRRMGERALETASERFLTEKVLTRTADLMLAKEGPQP